METALSISSSQFPMPVGVSTPDVRELTKTGLAIVDRAMSCEISSHEDYLMVGEEIKRIKTIKKNISAEFLKPKSLADQAHKSVCKLEKFALDPYDKADVIYSEKVKKHLQKVAQEERIETERRIKEAQIESNRLAEEAKKKQDDERMKIAEQLQAHGFKKEAEDVIAQDVPAPPPPVVVIRPVEKMEKVSGQYLRTTWRFEIDNLMLLVLEVAAGRQPITLLLPNQKALDDMAGAAKKELRIPGGRSVESSTLVTTNR